MYAAVTFAGQQSILTSQTAKQQELLAQQSGLEQQIESSQSQLDYIGTDAYVIREARERLGWLF